MTRLSVEVAHLPVFVLLAFGSGCAPDGPTTSPGCMLSSWIISVTMADPDPSLDPSPACLPSTLPRRPDGTVECVGEVQLPSGLATGCASIGLAPVEPTAAGGETRCVLPQVDETRSSLAETAFFYDVSSEVARGCSSGAQLGATRVWRVPAGAITSVRCATGTAACGLELATDLDAGARDAR